MTLNQGYGEAAAAGLSLINSLINKKGQGGSSSGGGGGDSPMDMVNQTQSQSVTQAQSNSQNVNIGSTIGAPTTSGGSPLDMLGILSPPTNYATPAAVSITPQANNNLVKYILIGGAIVGVYLIYKKRNQRHGLVRY